MKKQWMVNKVSTECMGCKGKFLPGQTFYSLLKLQKADVVTWYAERFDYCAECWKAVDKKGEGSSYWKSAFAAGIDNEEKKISARTKAGKFEKLRVFLFAQTECKDKRHANLLFAIALMLERKKILIPCPAGDNGALVYRHSRSGDIIVLKAPEDIREDQNFIDGKIMEILDDKPESKDETAESTQTPSQENLQQSDLDI